jgi:hypothetical protein
MNVRFINHPFVRSLWKTQYRNSPKVYERLVLCADKWLTIYPDSSEKLLQIFYEACLGKSMETVMFQISTIPYLSGFTTSRKVAKSLLSLLPKSAVNHQITFIYLRYVNDLLRGQVSSKTLPINLNKSYFFEHEVKAALFTALEQLIDDFQISDVSESNRQMIKELTSPDNYAKYSQECFNAGWGCFDTNWPNPRRDMLIKVCYKNNHYFTFNNTFQAQLYINTTLQQLTSHFAEVQIPVKYHEYKQSPEFQRLSVPQQNIIHSTLTSRFLIITGHPGTGKTTVLAEVNNISSENTIFLCSYNKAVVRAHNLGITTAMTVDSFLWSSASFDDVERIIVDESSVLSTRALYRLVRKCKYLHSWPHAFSLILVGDPNQLSPVKSGSVFADLIAKYSDFVCDLTTVFRTKSLKLLNLHDSMRINSSKLLSSNNKFASDNSLLVTTNQNICLSQYDFTGSCILIAFSNKTVNFFNMKLREKHKKILKQKRRLVNLTLKGKRKKQYFEHEKLVANHNCKDCGVFKGMIGEVVNVTENNTNGCSQKHKLRIIIDNNINSSVVCSECWGSGYAITSHKSQGSEWNTVIAVYNRSNSYITRRSAYTAVTRGKTRVVLITNQKAWASIVKNNPSLTGTTMLLTIDNMTVNQPSRECIQLPPEPPQFDKIRNMFHKPEQKKIELEQFRYNAPTSAKRLAKDFIGSPAAKKPNFSR